MTVKLNFLYPRSVPIFSYTLYFSKHLRKLKDIYIYRDTNGCFNSFLLLFWQMILQLNYTAIIFYEQEYILQFSLSSVYMAESYSDISHFNWFTSLHVHI